MRAQLVAGALLASGVALSGCAANQTDNANWLVNSQERTYVEIPPKFKRFTVNQFKVDKFDRSAERISALPRNPGNWEVIFDSAKKPQVANFDADRPTSMVGQVAVYSLSDDWTNTPNFRQGVNLTELRSYPFGRTGNVDPIAAFNDGDPGIEVVSYSEVAGKNGIRGIKLRFNQKVGPSEWLTIDQQAFTNRDTTKLYVLTLKCASTCFKRDYETAKKISSSFTVQK
jgi:hypothetical protein